MSGRLLGGVIHRDLEDGGSLKIVETTRRTSTTERLKVVLSDAVSYRPVRVGWSDAETGQIVFDHLRKGPWLLIVLDPTEAYAPESMIREATADGSRP
ncbi:MAG: hypothetical protein H6974_12335 [Gammaproteobacteria bacterium]|nr:hypothetical protein [Gammaproteobacteria bacterium]